MEIQLESALVKSSLASYLVSHPNKDKILSSLTEEEIASLIYDWDFWARPKQRTPIGNWSHWINLAGRGYGKTRIGSEWIRERVYSGAKTIGLVGRTAADVRDVMVEGVSGILSVFPPNERPKYEPSKRKITFHTGCVALLFSAEEPDKLRGPQFEFAWCDELASWSYLTETWDNLMFGLRLGVHPQVCITTTPRPLAILKKLMKDERTVLSTGSTYENKDNLSDSFIINIKEKYEGTRLGRQEIFAEVLTDTPGALWTYGAIDSLRIKEEPKNLTRIVIGVDPAVTSGENSDETGIIVCGKDAGKKGYVLSDISILASPDTWARKVVNAYHEYKANLVVVETNQGGDLVVNLIRTIDPRIPIKKIHAKKGKMLRAEPVAALYEQNKIHHVGGFSKLEDEMCTYNGEATEISPNRLDALVYAISELMLGVELDFTPVKAD